VAIYLGKAPESNFGRTPDGWVRDPKLSAKAKGVLSYLLSHRSGYDLTMEQIVAEMKDGPAAIYAALRELEKAGYLKRVQRRGERGKVAGVDFLVVGVDGEFPQVTTASRFSECGEPPASADQGECGVSAGETASRFSAYGESATKKTTNLEDKEDQGTELNWRTADAAREPGNDLLPGLDDSVQPTARAVFEDWRGPDYDTFRFLVGADHIRSDGREWKAGTYPTDALYRTLKVRAKNPLDWPGKYLDRINSNNGVEEYLASLGIEPHYAQEDAA
jgi:hypothetical protein